MIDLTGGKVNVSEALDEYDYAWNRFISTHKLSGFNDMVIPTTLSWKVASKSELFNNLEKLAVDTEQVHIGTVNDRYIASALLTKPFKSLYIIKILERRAGSKDYLGLDSIDYLVRDAEEIFKILKNVETNIIKENNDMHEWLSLRFGEHDRFEAKFANHLVLDVAIKEMNLANSQVLKDLDRKRV